MICFQHLFTIWANVIGCWFLQPVSPLTYIMLRRIAGTHIVCICSSKSYPQIPSLDSSDILFLVMEESTYPTQYSLPVSWSVYWCKFGGINHIKNLDQKLFSPKMQEGLGRGMLVCCETSWHNTKRCILLNRMCMRKTITPQQERERPSTTDISQVIENEAPRTWKRACNCNQNTKATIESGIILHHISIDFCSNYHKIWSQIHGSS